MKISSCHRNIIKNLIFFFKDKNLYEICALVIILFWEIIFTVVFSNKGLILIIASTAILFFFIYTLFSIEKSYYLCAAYFLIFPEKYYSIFFPGVPISFYWIIGYPIFLLSVLYWITFLFKHRIELKFGILDKTITGLFLSIIIAAVFGILQGHKFEYLRLEILPLSLHLVYFIFLYSSLKDNPRRFYDFITFCALIIAFEFIDSMLKFWGQIFLVRIVSMHIHISQLAIAYLGAILIYASSKKRKIIAGFLLPIILLSVAISQQRALWGATLVILVFLIAIFIYERRRRLKENYLKILRISTVIAIIVLGSYLIVNKITNNMLYNTIIARGQILFKFESLRYDASYKVRTAEIVEALRTIKNDFLLGKGLGASVITRWRLTEHIWVDNSYAYIYWKMGILGLVTFFLFYFTFFKRGLGLLQKKITEDERIYTLATLLNFISLFIVGLTNTCIITYRFIIVWAASIAIVESIARKYD